MIKDKFKMQLELFFTLIFTLIATIANWSELSPIQRALYPLWVLGMCLPIF